MNSRTLLLAAAAAVFVAGAAQAATLTVIPPDPLGTSTTVLGINNAGEMAGTARVGGVQVGFVRSAAGVYTTFSVNTTTSVRSINNAGQVVGFATDATSSFLTDKVFERAANGVITIVQDPTTGMNLHGLGSAENASGMLVGDVANRTAGFLLDGSTLTDFQATGGSLTSARGIEDDGTIAGFAVFGGALEGYVGAGAAFSFFTDPNATAGSETFFEAINNNGLVAGQWKDASNSDHAFLFDSNTHVFTELNVPGADMGPNEGVDAFGINDLGEVVLTADVRGATENFLYNPAGVPEPATWAVMLTGFFGLGSVLRRRRMAPAV